MSNSESILVEVATEVVLVPAIESTLVTHGEQGPRGVPGPEGVGKSAYQSAVELGFVGTEADWLDSLHGGKGEPGDPGAKGDTGEKGDQRLFVSDTAPTFPPGETGVWVQTGLGAGGTGITFWIEDGK